MNVLDRTDTSAMVASFNSAAVHLTRMEGYSITATWTDGGSLAGTLKLQACNNAFVDNGVDNSEDPAAVWVDIPGSSVAVSGAGNQIWNTSDAYYKSVRIVWTRSAGSGTYTAYIHAKAPY